MTPSEHKRDAAIERAKLAIGFGWDDVPCTVEGCGSRVSRTYQGKTRCWDHYDGPLQLEIGD